MDIETYLENNEHKILCICFYNGVSTRRYYIADFDFNVKTMLDRVFDNIFIERYHNHNIYTHIPP